jgi:hypothetical protein
MPYLLQFFLSLGLCLGVNYLLRLPSRKEIF